MKHGDLYSVDDALFFNAKKNIDDNVFIDDRHHSEIDRKIEKFEKQLRLVDSHELSTIFDDLL